MLNSEATRPWPLVEEDHMSTVPATPAPEAQRPFTGHYYLALAAWPLYLFLLPEAFQRLGWAAVPLVVFPGVYLFTWLGVLAHECGHRMVPGLPQRALFRLYFWMLL